jgi:hypothetical protein
MKTLAFNTSSSQKLVHASVENATEQQLAPRYGQDLCQQIREIRLAIFFSKS